MNPIKPVPSPGGIGTSPTHVYFNHEVVLANADTGPIGRRMVKAGPSSLGNWKLAVDWERRVVSILCIHGTVPRETLVPMESVSSFFFHGEAAHDE